MLEAPDSSFRLWGYGIALQSISLTRQGLVIRNGDQQVLVPSEDIGHFREQLALLLAQASAGTEQSNVARGA